MSNLLAIVKLEHTITENLDANELPSLAVRNITYNGFNTNFSLNSTSTPAANLKYVNTHNDLTTTLDLTALDDPIMGIIDATGEKLISLLLNNLSSVYDLVLAAGDTDPYEVLNGKDLLLRPSQRVLLYFGKTADVVSSTAKTIKLSFTTTTATTTTGGVTSTTTTTTTGAYDTTFQISLIFGS